MAKKAKKAKKAKSSAKKNGRHPPVRPPPKHKKK
jgi:hypothetical protein